MRKSKKEAVQEKQPEPQKIEVRLESGKLFFKVNSKSFYFDERAAVFLLGRDFQMRLEQTEEEGDIYPEFQTVKSLAKFQFFSNRRLPIDEFCKAQGYDSLKFKKWISLNSKMIKDFMATRRPEINAEVERLEKENPLPEPEQLKEFIPQGLKQTEKIAKFLNEGLGLREVASRLKVDDYSGFARWISSPVGSKMIAQARRKMTEAENIEANRAEEEAKEQSEVTVLG